jgi:hypothetical protein
MKILNYFLTSFLVVMLVFITVQAFAQVAAPGAFETVSGGNKVFGFLKEINALNLALIAFATFAGGMWAMGRSKLKLISDLFLKAYEYTDDKRLSAEERSDLIQTFLCIIGRANVPQEQLKKFVDE